MKRAIVVTSITLGMLLAALDTMIMSTAMPEIKDKLGDFELYSWVFSAYMLTSTVTVPIYGKLADMFGRKKVFVYSLLFFILGSLLCGFAQNMWQLVLYRAVQGLGAGGVIPLAVTISGDLYSVEERGKIQGLFSSMWAISGISGPVLGGWIIQHFSWSWIFWINIPIGLLAVCGMFAFDEKVEAQARKIDVSGALLLTLGISSFLFATLSERIGTMALFVVASVLLLYWFVRVERKKEHPLVRLDLLNHPAIKWINVTTIIVSMGLFALPSFIPLFAQDVLGYSPLKSGLVLLGQVAGWNVFAVAAGKLIIRYGYKKMIVAGVVLMAAGAIILLIFGGNTTYWGLVFIMFVLGMGFGLAMTTFVIGVQEAVDWHERGISTSIQMFFRNIGATLGVTIVGGIMNAVSASYSLAATFQFIFFVSVVITLLGLVTSWRVPAQVKKVLSHA
ncbi:MDR family MFS transporter [Bacillaceae bacterium]